MLKIPIENIPWEGIDFPVLLGPEWFERWLAEDPGLEFSPASPLTGTIHLEKPGDHILIRGELTGELQYTCSRCLELFSAPLECRFELVLEPGIPPGAGEEGVEIELRADELDLDYYAGDELDLDRIIKEQILLAMPLKPLCREDCRGLCPHCGANLNRDSCSCGEVKMQHPFAILEKLKKPS